jgi:predicted RNase H-like HicB family nuclease
MSEETVTYHVHIHDDGPDGLWTEVEELPGCFASGFNMDELRESLAEAIGLYLFEPGHESDGSASFGLT